jgi:hypothetical protein
MQIKITPKLPDYGQELTSFFLRRLALQIDEAFPWPAESLHRTMVSVQTRRIWLTWLGPFTEAQLCWLQDSPQVLRWKWARGGTLSLPDQRITLSAPAGFFRYEQDETRYSLALSAAPLPITLYVSPGEDHLIRTEEQLLELVQQAGLPPIGWRQDLRLCVRCDAPGAHPVTKRCLDCMEAYHAFMQPPLDIMQHQDVETNPACRTALEQLLIERRLPLPNDPMPDVDDFIQGEEEL